MMQPGSDTAALFRSHGKDARIVSLALETQLALERSEVSL